MCFGVLANRLVQDGDSPGVTIRRRKASTGTSDSQTDCSTRGELTIDDPPNLILILFSPAEFRIIRRGVLYSDGSDRVSKGDMQGPQTGNKKGVCSKRKGTSDEE